MQGGLADIWKEKILENLEESLLEYETVGKFLADIREKFGEDNEEILKMAELKKLEQGEKIIGKFFQEFMRVVRGSRYKGRLLVKKFKKEINRMIHQKLIESERQPSSIKQ